MKVVTNQKGGAPTLRAECWDDEVKKEGTTWASTT